MIPLPFATTDISEPNRRDDVAMALAVDGLAGLIRAASSPYLHALRAAYETVPRRENPDEFAGCSPRTIGTVEVDDHVIDRQVAAVPHHGSPDRHRQWRYRVIPLEESVPSRDEIRLLGTLSLFTPFDIEPFG